MPSFSKQSRDKLQKLHPDLVKILAEAIKYIDFTVLCTYRGREEQDKAYKEGKSKAKYGQSPHNCNPALAVDVAPYPIDWEDKKRFEELARMLQYCADREEIQITWGGNFSFVDMPHFELTNWRTRRGTV